VIIIKKDTFYITTPIYYPSAAAHIGHAFCTIAADVLARWNRLLGKEVFFLVGTDEHGQKIQQAANDLKKTPQEFLDEIVQKYKELWKLLNISHDDFIRTTEKRHETAVAKFIKKIFETGDIYKGNYEGLYCVPCETFFTELQAPEKKCPDCNRPIKDVKEEAYFFKLSKYQKPLLDFYEKNPEFLSPKNKRKEIINRVKEGLKDLCITRATVSWGIPFPEDKKHTIYVWVDALQNYITALDYPDGEKFKKFWPADIHLVGKEINWFHSVIWPALLLSGGINLPKKVYAHGWWTVEGEKMSKSKGNVIDPVKVVSDFGVDQLRYFLLREVKFGSDGDYSESRLKETINNDLANGLGNLVNRSIVMTEKYFDGKVPAIKINKAISEKAIKTVSSVTSHLEQLEFQETLLEIWNLITECNQYINKEKPWENESKREEVIYTLLESLRFISTLTYPFIPETSEKIFSQLGIGPQKISDLKTFGLLKEGTKVKKGEVLFHKIPQCHRCGKLYIKESLSKNICFQCGIDSKPGEVKFGKFNN
jgi:methionyl-tRNA synthetase